MAFDQTQKMHSLQSTGNKQQKKTNQEKAGFWTINGHRIM